MGLIHAHSRNAWYLYVTCRVSACNLPVPIGLHAPRSPALHAVHTHMPRNSRFSFRFSTIPASAVPVDVWEAVLDAVYDAYYHHPSDFVWQSDPNHRFAGPLHNFHDLALRQRTLRSCALTCRAWRERAQFLLWKHVVFTVEPSRQFSALLAAMLSRIADYQSPPVVSSLYMLGQHMPIYGLMGRAIPPLPHWNLPLATSWDSEVEPGPPSALDRVRRPFFPALTDINLMRCTFNSVCDFFEFLWSCPRLSHLVLQDCDLQTGHVDSVAILSMDVFAREHQTEILTNLTSLYIHVSTI